jgi:hypothetical protein
VNKTNTGGPAFPALCQSVNGVPLSPGMSLRAYLAAKSLNLAHGDELAEQLHRHEGLSAARRAVMPSAVARRALDYADAILQALENEQ